MKISKIQRFFKNDISKVWECTSAGEYKTGGTGNNGLPIKEAAFIKPIF